MTDSHYISAQQQTKKDNILGHSISPANKDRKGIVFTLDRGYLKQLSVMLASIIEHADNKKTYDLIVYENTFSEKDRRQLKAQCPLNISLRFFDVTHRLKTDLKGITLYTRSWWTNAIWYKCLIPFVMRQYRQTLYLDVDAIVQTDIANLFDDQQNTPLAAVRDVLAYTIHRPENQKTAQYLKNIGIEHPENYFNAGVLRYNHALIDIDQYQQNLISAYTQKGPFNCPEQDLLNILYQTNVTLMPFENNYQIQINPSQTFKQNYQKLEHKPLEQSSRSAKILHYFGAIKPWHLKTPVIEHFDTYWQYIKTSPYKHTFEQEAQQSQNQLVTQQKHPYRLRFNYIKAKLLSKLSQNEKKDYWEQQRQYYKNQLIKTKSLKSLTLCALTDTDTPDSVSTPSRVSTPVKTKEQSQSKEKGNTNNPLSVVVTSYNYEKYIGATLESLVKQSIPNLEIIVVDDGSQDQSVAIIKNYCRQYPNIHLYQHQGGVNRGLPSSTKLGIQKASGQYIAFCESDDYWDKHHAASLLEYLKQHPDANILTNAIIVINTSSNPTYDAYVDRSLKFLSQNSQKNIFRTLINCHMPTLSAVCVRKDLLMACDFQPYVPQSLDFWLYRQLCLKHPIHYVTNAKTYWRRHNQSYDYTKTKKNINQEMAFLEASNQLLMAQENIPITPYDKINIALLKALPKSRRKIIQYTMKTIYRQAIEKY